MAELTHYVAPIKSTEIVVDELHVSQKSGSFLSEAWRNLRHNPLFFVSSFFLLVLLLIALFPTLWTNGDPRSCDITTSRLGIGVGGHLLGTTLQGCDIYTRLIYGAGTSMQIGVTVTLIGTFIGIIWGSLSGYAGGVVDAIMSRVLEVFISIPGLLAFMVILQLMRDVEGTTKMILVFSIFSWMGIARLTRGNIMQVKSQEFITSSISLGASKSSIMFRHALPNSLGPVIATATMSVGGWIVMEASMSFLGLGLGSNQVSWGADISNAASNFTTWTQSPHVLFFPSLMLALASLTFIFLGDAIHSAIDPKERR